MNLLIEWGVGVWFANLNVHTTCEKSGHTTSTLRTWEKFENAALILLLGLLSTLIRHENMEGGCRGCAPPPPTLRWSFLRISLLKFVYPPVSDVIPWGAPPGSAPGSENIGCIALYVIFQIETSFFKNLRHCVDRDKEFLITHRKNAKLTT